MGTMNDCTPFYTIVVEVYVGTKMIDQNMLDCPSVEWLTTACFVHFLTAPAPILNRRLLRPPWRDSPSTPAKRGRRRRRKKRSRRRQCRDTTPPTPSSTRTPSCRGWRTVAAPALGPHWKHMYTCTAYAVYLHTCHSIMPCTSKLLTLNWLSLLWYWELGGEGQTFFFALWKLKQSVGLLSIWMDTLSSIFCVFDCFFCTYHFWWSNHELLAFLPMQLFSLCTATETYCHKFSSRENLNKPKKHNALYHIHPLSFLSSYIATTINKCYVYIIT